MSASVTRDGTICTKNSTFGYLNESNPLLKKGIQLRSPILIIAPDVNKKETHFKTVEAMTAKRSDFSDVT